MNKSLLSFLFIILISTLQAQVKIGNNPNTINANSILELEATNKGFLPPRVALTSVNSTTPLTATTPSGMLVYSSGGTITDGYYFWNGVKWLALSTSALTRTNHVIVKSASDFPAAVGGVITLSTGVLYEINGTISLNSMINLNGCSILGQDAANDKLVYTGSSELFTGSGTGNIRQVTLQASSGKVFNINAGGTNKNLLIQNCYIIGCNSVGTIQGVGGTVFMQTVAYFSNVSGITFQNNTYVVVNNTLWDASNQSYYERFTGTFSIIQLLGGDRVTSSVNSAVALHISGITSLGAGNVKSVMFTGTGTFISGTFSNSWEVESFGLATEKDDVASANLYMVTPVTTSFTAANTPSKILGTTSAVSFFRVTSPINNRLVYTGSKIRRFSLICSMTATQGANNGNYSFYIYKNGVAMPESQQTIKMNSNTDQTSLSLSCTVLMSPNDYVEVWVENNTNNSSINIQTLNLAIK